MAVDRSPARSDGVGVFTRGQLMQAEVLGADWTMNRRDSISSQVGRATYEGKPAVLLGSDASAKTQITAFLDLLDLNLFGSASGPAQANQMAILLSDPAPEAVGALQTLAEAMTSGPDVRTLRAVGHDSWEPVGAAAWSIDDERHYPTWRNLLERVSSPPDLVTTLVAQVDFPELRAYPMLTKKGYWSLRLEGLEVGRVSAEGGQLGVGKDGKQDATGAAVRSASRTAWVDATGKTDPVAVSGEPAAIAEAIHLIRSFAARWSDPGTHKVGLQNEHALESRILRGLVPVTVSDKRLELIQPDDAIVNWGSQFPTKWGPGGRARYLDALLKDGNVPWAIEMKVEGSASVGNYYRHAIAQAVLYREFIRQAKPLRPWFTARGLRPEHCEGAVLVPRMKPDQQTKRARLHSLSSLFGIELIEVDPRYATVAPF